MTGVLDSSSSRLARRPWAALGVLALVTVVIGSFATRLEQDADIESFAPSGGAAAVLEDVRSNFGGGGAVGVQVLVDAGPEGDIISPEGLAATESVTVVAADAAGDRVANSEQPAQSFAGVVRAALELAGGGEGEPDPEVLDQVVAAVLRSPAGSSAAGLFSEDLDVDAGSARATLVVVALDADLDDDAAIAAAEDIQEAVEQLDVSGVDLTTFGQPLLQQASSDLVSGELPRLLGVSVLLIAVVLGLVYRNLADVLIGMVGLGLALVWTYGLGSLLGPGWLGWTGPFNQITTVVPILVAGLGVDFALHLTTRRREARTDERPRQASRTTMATVGGALALTTLTTALGFLTNLFSPLPPIGDFGVFSAVGVASAFVVMMVLVPSTRTLLDRRRGAERAEPEDDTEPFPLVGRLAGLSIAHPVAVLGAAVALSAASVWAGLHVPTTFDTDDFVPSGSDVGEALAQVEQLFGADVSEQTYVLLSGDLASVPVANALAELPERLAEVEGVRSGAGQALVSSPTELVAQVAGTDPELAATFAELGWSEGRFEEGADVAGVYAALEESSPERAAQVLEPDGDRQLVIVRTSAGQDGAEELVDRLDDELAPLRDAGVETTFTGEELLFAETVDALTGSQLQSIGITVGAAALILVAYFWWRERSVGLGLTAMVPTVLVATWVVGGMWVLGLSFNVLTITIGSLAIALGVDYGIHIAHRFREEDQQRPTEEAIQHTVEQTGGALAGSAATTVAGFGVLVLSSITPIRQFGMITAMAIVGSVVAAVVVVPAILRLGWARSGADAN